MRPGPLLGCIIPYGRWPRDALDKPIDGSISVNRDLTTLALLRLITAASVFWIALQLCRDATRANILLWSVAALGCAYAAYGLFAFALTPGQVLWFKNPYSRGFVTSTFINPNSFVAYAGIGFIAICGLILRLYRHEFAAVGGSIRFRIATFIEVTGQKGAALLGGAAVILVALLLTGSRGGIVAMALALLVLGVLTLRPRKRQSVRAARGHYHLRCRFGGGNVLGVRRSRGREDHAAGIARRESACGLHDHAAIHPWGSDTWIRLRDLRRRVPHVSRSVREHVG